MSTWRQHGGAGEELSFLYRAEVTKQFRHGFVQKIAGERITYFKTGLDKIRSGLMV